MKTLPSMFVSHGSPMFAVEPGLLGPMLRSFGAELSGIKAVLVVSAHWETRDVRVAVSQRPKTIHDFGGFPGYLYTLEYPAEGHPALARVAAARLSSAGFKVTLDEWQGLDHGAWVPLLHMFPDANIPVFQVSMPNDLTPEEAIRFGEALAPLRDEGVLILASGSMTHNLRDVFSDVSYPQYAQEFADWIKSAVKQRNVTALVNYRDRAPHALRAHPSDEHFLPLFVALGASKESDAIRFLDGGVTYNVLSMDSIVFEQNNQDVHVS